MRSAEVLEYLARQLVDHPDDVRVEVGDDGDETVLELYVHSEDIGKVIGKRGRTAKALRTVVRAAAAMDDQQVSVEIVD